MDNGNLFYSTHQWTNGAVVTVQRVDNTTINIRIQDSSERMLADVLLAEYEALCIAHSILSVLTHPTEENNG